MESFYLQLDRDIDNLDPVQKKTFLKYKEIFAYFLVFYRKPSLFSFLRFFNRSPIWALASLVSSIINILKFKHLKPN
jgi:hypothetical protein